MTITSRPNSLIAGLLAGLMASIAAPSTDTARAADGFYSAQQAEKGHELYNNRCAECHRPDLSGAMGPALIGPPFFLHWGGKAVEALYQFEHEKMPATNPGSLPDDEVMAITAYILKRNNLPAGNTALDDATARKLMLPKAGGG